MLQLVARLGTSQNGPHPEWSERGNTMYTCTHTNLVPRPAALVNFVLQQVLGNETKFHTRGDRNGEVVEHDAFISHESWGMTLELG